MTSCPAGHVCFGPGMASGSTKPTYRLFSIRFINWNRNLNNKSIFLDPTTLSSRCTNKLKIISSAFDNAKVLYTTTTCCRVNQSKIPEELSTTSPSATHLSCLVHFQDQGNDGIQRCQPRHAVKKQHFQHFHRNNNKTLSQYYY
jgi:hypothetical protein